MKPLLVIVCVMLTAAAYGQHEVTSKDSLYIVTYTTGPAWDHSKSASEQLYFKEHSSRLGQLRKDGVIRFGARYGDKGSIVIAAKNFQAAKEIVDADGAVVNQVFVAEIHRLNIFFEGCLERPR